MKNDYYFEGEDLFILIRDKDNNIHKAIVDADEFDRVNKLPGMWSASRARGRSSIYVQGWYKGKTIGLHRWILRPDDDKVVDHINHDTLDNRKKNLRAVTHAENLQNHKGASKNSKSGVRGVYWDRTRNKWMAQYKLNGKSVNLGRYDTIAEAKKVVERERRKVMRYSS